MPQTWAMETDMVSRANFRASNITVLDYNFSSSSISTASGYDGQIVWTLVRKRVTFPDLALYVWAHVQRKLWIHKDPERCSQRPICKVPALQEQECVQKDLLHLVLDNPLLLFLKHQPLMCSCGGGCCDLKAVYCALCPIQTAQGQQTIAGQKRKEGGVSPQTYISFCSLAAHLIL